MTSKAQIEANKRYKRKMREEGKFKSVILEFYPSDLELYDWLQEHKPMATYIKELIRKDMNND